MSVPRTPVHRALQCVAALCVGVLFALTPAAAHQSGNSYLDINDAAGRLSVRIDFSIKDLPAMLQLAAGAAVEFTPAELAAHQARLRDTVQRRLVIEADGQALPLEFIAQSVRLRNEGLYVRQVYEVQAFAAALRQLVVHYNFFDSDAGAARAYARLVLQGQEISSVLDAQHPVQRFAVGEVGRLERAGSFVREGAVHIWGGADHLLFLLCLVLPGLALINPVRPWRWPSVRPALVFALQVVTAFTVAHSITLAAATLDWISLPNRWIEAVIALSIMLAAVLNLVVTGHAYHWRLAFGFGLIHGLGFANGLRELGLSHEHFVETLLAFNLGVEFGQLAVLVAGCALLLPWLNREWVRLRLAAWGSALVVPVSALWLTERLFA